jgi:hypothetical protein
VLYSIMPHEKQRDDHDQWRSTQRQLEDDLRRLAFHVACLRLKTPLNAG